jgi:hypothetical protein
VLSNPDGEPLTADQLEVAALERDRGPRAFRRVKGAELEQILTG